MPETSSPELAPGIRELLVAVRRRIRRYVWLEGLAATVAVLGLAFWLSLGADWFFEPPREVRFVFLATIAAAGLFSLVWFLLRRIVARLSDRSMAILLERRFGNLQDSLVTAVELTASGKPVEIDTYGREMLSETCREAARRSRQVQLNAVFNFRPLGQAVVAAGAIVLSIVAAAMASPDMLRFGLRRLTAATDDPWPRRTRLSIEGFDNPEREHVVARGMDFEILVHADASADKVVPQVVEVRYRTDDGKRDRGLMIREGIAVPGENALQDYRYTFSSVLNGVTFDVVGGDARLRGLRLRVVDSPNVALSLNCEYPAYMKRAPADVPVTGVMPLPVGTRIKVEASATKDLRQAQIDYLADDAPQSRKFALDGRRDFDFTIDRLASDQTLSFALLDADGVTNRGPIQLALTAVPDEPPQVDVRIEGIGSAITPQARLPLAGKIEDDYGVDRIWLEYTIDDGDPRQSELASPSGRSEFDVAMPFEVAALDLEPGQKLLVGVQAADNRAPPAADEPNVAQGERFLLDVVTPDQLLAILETRELNLRQRFETIIQEVTDTRDSLAEIEKAAADKMEPDESEADSSAATEEDSGAQRNVLRLERAEQNNQKNGEETRGVAAAFDDIRAELVNNRVDTEELRIRLKDRISDPLKQIVDVQFARLNRTLGDLRKQLSAGDAPDERAKAAIEQADGMIVALQKVRDQMLELETFNEAVDLLREIIAAQEKVSEQTKKERSKKLRSLLDDEE